VVKKITTLILVLIGMAIGGFISIVMYDKVFTESLKRLKDYTVEDWGRMEYYASKIVDRTIKYREMMDKDKMKYDPKPFDEAVAARSVILGGDTLKDKAAHIGRLEEAINTILEEYNKKMELRRERFYYLEWGMVTKEFIHEYKIKRDHYRDTVNEYNFRIKTMPFVLFAKGKGFEELPQIEESRLTAVQLATEEYSENSSEESPDSMEHGSR